MPIDAYDIDFAYGRSRPVLRAVSCSITAGRVTAIVGPNGAGKSTLVRLLAGLRTADSGRVLVDEKSIASIKPRTRARRIAFIEQRPDLAFDFSVMRVVSFGAYAAGSDRVHIDEALDRFELRDLAAMPYGALSVGQQQRVSIARAWVQIARRSDTYLLADEPCSAMDPRHTLQTMHALRELADLGVGVGVVVHDLSIGARFADRAIVLSPGGRLVREGPGSDVLTGAVLSDVFEIPILRREMPGCHPVLTAVDETAHPPRDS